MKRGKGWYALFVFPLVAVFLVVNIIPFIIGIGYTFI
ncbi:MAG: sugar ABC transporter permease, partial [Clostridiales bacterium]|nr:sugar ABC transporter permease [Clostridiales bacterium]